MHNPYSNSSDGYSYSIMILTLSTFRVKYINDFSYICNSHNIRKDEREILYDWLVKEAVNNVMIFKCYNKVQDHYKHDVYKCIYTEYKYILETHINNQINLHNLTFLREHLIKVMVAGDSLLLARGGN